MTNLDKKNLLDRLISNWESEVVEFKNVNDKYSNSDIGKYFSALSNEANLHNQDSAFLVFGVENSTRQIVGSHFRVEHDRLLGTKHDILSMIEPAITFRNISEVTVSGCRVIIFEIPAAPIGMPVSCNGFYYGRAHESLGPLSLDKLDEIRRQITTLDWTAQLVPGSTLDDLDSLAIEKARDAFAKKHANRFSVNEIKAWSNTTFLDRAKLTIDGAVTRAALLLLGKSESAHYLSPLLAQLTWRLSDGTSRGGEHFGLPFFLSTTQLYRKIRNVQIRILPKDELFAIEVAKYDQKIVLEALHNCIAHQDYLRGGRILVTEGMDGLVFENEGGFFEGIPADYVSGVKTPRRYRNPFLIQAMSELNMIDSMGYGIHEMYRGQIERYFPLPDFDLNELNTVKVKIYGNILDQAYSRLLIQKTDLSIDEVLALDRVQKKLPLDKTTFGILKKRNLIEGRKPNFHISVAVATVTASRAEYIRARSQDDEFYIKLIHSYLSKFGNASRKDIDKLLWSKLGDVLSESQKKNKITNLISKMRDSGGIRNFGSDRSPKWQLVAGKK